MRPTALLLFAAALVFAQTATVRGVVKDAVTGAPLPDFPVQVGATSTLTDSQGHYAVAKVAPGDLIVIARDLRHQTVTRSVHLNANDNLTFDFLIPGNATASGRVLDREKNAVAGALVWAVQREYNYGALRHGLIGPQITGKDGHFRFDYGLTAGRKFYLLADRQSAGDKTLIDTPTYYGDAISLGAATPIVLQPSEQRDGLEIKIRESPHYCLEGRVEVDGEPAALPFKIQEQPLAGTLVVRVDTRPRDDGTFRVCRLTPGEYRLSTIDTQKLAGSVDFAILDADVHQVRLAVDNAALHLNLSWDGDAPPPAPTGPVSRTVRTADGRELAVTTFPSDLYRFSLNLYGLTNESRLAKAIQPPYDGPFAAQLPAGDYLVDANTAPCCIYVKDLSYDGIPSPDRRLHLAPGTSGTLRLVIGQDGGTLSYKVTGADSKPMPDASVLLIPEGVTGTTMLADVMQQSRTDPAGIARNARALAPGKYRALAIDRAVLLPDDLDKIWLALFKAKDVQIAPKAKQEINLQAISIN